MRDTNPKKGEPFSAKYLIFSFYKCIQYFLFFKTFQNFSLKKWAIFLLIKNLLEQEHNRLLNFEIQLKISLLLLDREFCSLFISMISIISIIAFFWGAFHNITEKGHHYISMFPVETATTLSRAIHTKAKCMNPVVPAVH